MIDIPALSGRRILVFFRELRALEASSSCMSSKDDNSATKDKHSSLLVPGFRKHAKVTSQIQSSKSKQLQAQSETRGSPAKHGLIRTE